MNKKEQGFTLMELLAVVIIIALMAAVGTGYYKRAVEQARFPEGLMAASAIAEGVNREYKRSLLEEAEPIKQPKLKTLDISIAKNGSCTTSSDYCIKTKYFEMNVNGQGVVNAYRGTTSSYKYYIQIKPSFAMVDRGQVFCYGKSSSGVKFKGKEFCQSLGYTSCTSAGACRKP